MKNMTKKTAVAKLLSLMDAHNAGPVDAKAYVHVWDKRWPLIAEAGWATTNAGAAYMRGDHGAAPLIVAMESYLASLVDGDATELKYAEESLIELLKADM